MRTLGSIVLLALANAASAQVVWRVSVATDGTEANGPSYVAVLSGDGRFVAFESDATNLVASDTNKFGDAFRHDNVTGETIRISVDDAGKQANSSCWPWSISNDGQYTLFSSDATNLDPNAANGFSNLYIYDAIKQHLSLLTHAEDGSAADGPTYYGVIAGKGESTVFCTDATNFVKSDTNGAAEIVMEYLLSGQRTRVSVTSTGGEPNAGCYEPSICDDGSKVCYSSDATNIVPGDTNGLRDIFLFDVASALVQRVSLGPGGVEPNGNCLNPRISGDGRWVTYETDATNLFANDTNGVRDVVVWDSVNQVTIPMSLSYLDLPSDGWSAGASPWSVENLDPVHDVEAVFWSYALNLAAGDDNAHTDVFFRDGRGGTTQCLSLTPSGKFANGDSFQPSLSHNGQFASFQSYATNLVTGDTNGVPDIFMVNRCDAQWWNYGTGWAGTYSVPTLTAQGDPILGSTVTFDLSDSAGHDTVGLLGVGFSRNDFQFRFGATFLVTPAFLLPVPVTAPDLLLAVDLPDDDNYCGLTVDVQGIELDAGAVHGLSFTNGFEMILGQY